MRIPANLLVHTVTVQPLRGESSTGKVWGEAFPLQCMAQGGLRRVVSAEGDTATATLTLYAEPGNAARIPTGSVVTWNGTRTGVLQSIEHDDGGLGAPQHAEVVCG